MITVDDIKIERVFNIDMEVGNGGCLIIEFWHDKRMHKRLTDLSQLEDYEYTHYKTNDDEIDYVKLELPISYKIHYRKERMSIRVQGIAQALKALDNYKDSKTEQLEKATQRATVNVDRKAKKNVPVNTGRLKTSIHRTNNKLSGTVFTNVEYAPYVEFGTGSMVEVPSGLEDYAMQFKGKGVRQVNLPARPFLFPAWEVVRPQYIKDIKDILSSIR